MGATDFSSIAAGKTSREAFEAAKASALHQYGHGGYTGTLAEKDDFIVIPTPPLTSSDAADLAEELIANDDDRISDKWGPAGAIAVEGGQWLFFGFASS
ncbi:hypothetical protein [Rhodococcoides fascians]|uniref:hypothetical protein n=1 Tax=Rhodococcoides fascians TaxID=1828 RepID=UPI00050CD54F|nr:hypothetical protein [Rhodococcus fascians]